MPKSWDFGDCHGLWSCVQVHKSLPVLKKDIKICQKYKSTTSSVIPPESTFGKSPQCLTLSKGTITYPGHSSELKRECPVVHNDGCSPQVFHYAGGEVQLYGNTCTVTVSSQGTEKADEKNIS